MIDEYTDADVNSLQAVGRSIADCLRIAATILSQHPPLKRDQPGASLGSTRRGQSTMIGMVFVIVIVLGVFVFAQTTLAPQARNNAEIQHNTQVVLDFQAIHGDTLTGAASGDRGTSALQMGQKYPNPVIYVHPPDPAGALRTGSEQNVRLTGVEAVNSETADYLDGSDIEYDHQPLRYSPIYNEFRTAGDSVVEHGTYYQDYDGSTEIVGTTNLIEGNTVRLTATTGDTSVTTQQGRLVETVPLSGDEQTVIVEDTGSNPEIRIETNLDAATWETMLEDEIDPSAVNLNNDRYVVDVRDGSGDTVVIELEAGATYELNTAKLHHKTSAQPAAPKSEVPGVAYLTTNDATNATVQADSTEQFTIDVRDSFNNPEANVPLDVQTVRPSSDAELVTRVSRTDGTVTVLYTAPSTSPPPDDELRVCVESCGASSLSNEEVVIFEITIS